MSSRALTLLRASHSCASHSPAHFALLSLSDNMRVYVGVNTDVIFFVDAGFFVFPDLSVRTEGSYRLKLSLFEVVA